MLLDVPRQCARIAAARAAGPELFLNARVDVHLLADPGDRVAEALRRAERYLAAGADGIFVPAASTAASIGALVRGIGAPVNVMAGTGSPTVRQLGELGVARVSVGQAISQAAYAVARRAAVELLTTGTYGELADGLDYAAMNSLPAKG